MLSNKIVIIKEFISKNFFKVTCKGNSMYPTLHDGDNVEVQSLSRDIACGDIILYYLYKNEDLMFVLHRVHYINNEYLVLKGDNNISFDVPIRKSQVLGVVNLSGNFDINDKAAIHFLDEVYKKNEHQKEKDI